MPAINRIRFVNISYDNRNIKDCIFNMYSGSDALMNLSNGGGKSVMVQLLFQPVLPGASLGGRNITDYLPKNDTPIHIMIEWILDNTKPQQYYLTGICMGLNRENSEETGGQNNISYKYFTYTHTYTEGNEFDIEHIPVKEVQGKITTINKYDTVFEKIKKSSRSNPNFCYFPKSRLSEYEQNLSQHRIYKSEWKLLQKINQEEGGLIKHFDNCKTSDELFDKWILKTVSDNLTAARENLIECVTELVKPMIKENDDLQQKELLEKLLFDVKNFKDSFSGYCTSLDNKEQKERTLAGALEYTKIKQREAVENMEKSRKIQEKCREEELHIDKEEISENIKNSENNIEITGNNIRQTQEKLSELKNILETSEHDFKCMEAAQYYSDIKKCKNKIEAARSIIETLDKGEEALRIRNIGFTLSKKYSEKVNGYNEKYAENSRNIEKIGQDIINFTKHKTSLEKERNRLANRIAVLKNNTEKFVETRKKYAEQLGELPQCDRTGNLNPYSVEDIRKNLENNLKFAQIRAGNLEAEKTDIENKIVKYNNDAKNLRKNIEKNQKDLAHAKIKLDNCNKQIDKIKNILSEYEINENYLFEKESNVNLIREKITEFNKQCDNAKRMLDYKSELLEKLNKKQLHIAKEFADILEENGIDYQTGEDFLSNQPVEYFERLVGANPMLPYCFIVSDKDFDKIIDINDNFSVDRICPVIRKSSIEKTFSDNEIKFYSLFNRESISAETKENYGRLLESEIKEIKKNISFLENKRNRCSSHCDAIENFEYTAEEYKLIQADVEIAKKSLNNLKTELAQNESDTDELHRKSELLREDIREAKEIISEEKSRINLFEDYIKLEENNIAETEEMHSKQETVEEIETDIENISGNIENLRQEEKNKLNEQKDTEYKIKEYTEKSAKYSAYPSGEFISSPEEQLENEFEELFSRAGAQREEQQKICSEMSAKIAGNQKTLKKRYPQLSEDDYNIEYNEDILLNLENKYKESEKGFNETKTDITILESDMKRFKRTHEKYLRKLKDNYGMNERLPDNEIYGNYPERRVKLLEEKKSAEINENNFRKEERCLSGRINELEKIVPSELIGSNDISIEEKDIDIESEKKALFNLKSDVSDKKRNVKKLYESIKKSYENINDLTVNQVIERMDFNDYESYNECYHLYEDLCTTEIQINNAVQYIYSKLNGIENDIHNIIFQVYKHAEILYKEVNSIFNNSYANIQGDKRHKIMSINIPQELDTQAENRISDFVNSELVKIRNNAVKENYDDMQLHKEVGKAFSDRRIINVLTNMTTYRIKVYKVYENAVNSGLKLWEEKYSGGEKFVTYFIIFSALTAYSRMASSTESRDATYSVFLSDNPFGATSSPHLLDALVRITRKYNLQLVCFTALEQSSITNKFDLIYQLAMKQSVHSNKSYLEINDIIKNNDEISFDTNLEFISVKSQKSLSEDT